MPSLPRTLFVGRGAGAVCWYRCALPAMALGVEWIGAVGEPPELMVGPGVTEHPVSLEDFTGYEVLILQQPTGPGWVRAIRELQASGVKVLFEVDDYVHAIGKLGDHEFAADFGEAKIRQYELAMGVCDGLIVSTEYLAQRYCRFNSNVFVCRNGLDLKRFDLTRVARDRVNVGWSGATGHAEALRPWLTAVGEVLRERSNSGFVTLGQVYASDFECEFGTERIRSLPFSALDSYPAGMTLFDVALAPAARNGFFRGKSDLRWLEAGALGIPVIGDPDVYPDIVHGVTGFHATTPAEVRRLLLDLVDDPGLRERVGAAARAHVREHRSIEAMAGAWASAIAEVAPVAGDRVG